MTVAAFDTLKFVRALREKAKLSNEQAEGFAEAIAEAVHSDLATKSDIGVIRNEIEELRREMKAEFAELRREMKADIAELRAETKASLAELRREMKADLAELRAETKADLAELRREMKADVDDHRAETKADSASIRSSLRETELRLEAKIEGMKSETLKWVFGMIGFQTLIILGAVVTLARVLQP